MKKRQYIDIHNAKVHNLKGVNLKLPRNRFIVVTGVSGSGKSSLVFDTLYAEGHRRYVESLSSYARQFLSRMDKPEVDAILGLSPAIAIEQRVNTSNPRSTVGSITEVYDYLRLLYARIGRTFSPVSGQEVTRHTVSYVVDFIRQQPQGSRAYLLVQIQPGERDLRKELDINLQKGFLNVLVGGKRLSIETILEQDGEIFLEDAWLLIDRFKVKPDWDEDMLHRVADSVQTAFNEGFGRCAVKLEDADPEEFSEIFEADGIRFEEPNVNFFNYNNPFGVCQHCEGFGTLLGYDERLIVPNPDKSVAEGAVAPWQGNSMSAYQRNFLKHAPAFDFPMHRPYRDLSAAEKALLWDGNSKVIGINDFLADLESQTYKIHIRVFLSRWRSHVTCPECQGSRIRKEANYVKAGGYSIGQLLLMPIDELAQVMQTLKLTDYEQEVSKRILREVHSRLQYLLDVGLGYLTLNRRASTLSGGETQRINLATSLGSSLVGSMYILDEPSIGLHPRDGQRLIGVLQSLRELGNTVIVVEHDDAVMRQAEYLVDVGPAAGEHGGQVVFAGPPEELLAATDALTADYLLGKRQVPLPTKRRSPQGEILVRGAAEHNLKNLDAAFPLGVLSVVSGVSGSGKTTLVKRILHPALLRQLDHAADVGRFDRLEGDVSAIQHVELVDQGALGRNVRSNPVTYCGAYDFIRELYASQPQAKEARLKPLHFSFNVDGGRCETCKGEGFTTVEMQFLPDVKLLCETCGGKRFKPSVLEVAWKQHNIYDILNLTVQEAWELFEGQDKIQQRLQQLLDVGLGYLRLGQSTSTLSGGEAQRLKLASFLNRKEELKTLYIFDEPTTGLHAHDVAQLLKTLHRLVDLGHTVVIIEHNLDVIKNADWVLDLGPEGGGKGGELVFAGTPEELAGHPDSHTGRFLKEKLAEHHTARVDQG